MTANPDWTYGYIAALVEASLFMDDEAKRWDKNNGNNPSIGGGALRSAAEMLRREASIKRRIMDGLPPIDHIGKSD